MVRALKILVMLSALLFNTIIANATPYFTSTVQGIGSDRWQYDYVVTNDLSDRVITEFNIYFNPELYQLLADVTPILSGWSSQVVEPVPFTTSTIPQDGFFNAISSGTGIGPLSSLGGFSVSFEWLGFDTPLDNDLQSFDYVTAPFSPPEPVPEPGTILLLSAGIIGLVAARRSRITASKSNT